MLEGPAHLLLPWTSTVKSQYVTSKISYTWNRINVDNMCIHFRVVIIASYNGVMTCGGTSLKGIIIIAFLQWSYYLWRTGGMGLKGIVIIALQRSHKASRIQIFVQYRG